MSYQEKENIVNIFSAVIIAGIYALIVYQRHLQGQFDLTQDYREWGIIFLIFIAVSIVARIIIYIIFYVINYIATREEEKTIEDERVKLIKLKSDRNGNRIFSLGMVMAIVALAIGMPVYGIFIAFIVSCVLSEITDNLSQIYYNRKGV
jgi:predicted CDP-diglyceride synthetase/phosphatidate cytidylyltransferase